MNKHLKDLISSSDNRIPSKREQRMRKEENNDTKMEVEIINKETGKIVDRINDYEDAAIKWANNQIWGKPYLKWKSYKMQAE